MRIYIGVLLGCLVLFSSLKPHNDVNVDWTADELKAANTAKLQKQLTDDEKNIFLYVNLARLYPKKFIAIYLVGDKYVSPFDQKSAYLKSLIQEMKSMKPLNALLPDSGKLYESAKCHAAESGKSGCVGHSRKKCVANYSAECCSYGFGDGLSIVLQLLVDKDVPSLGHRKAVLGAYYKKLGTSIHSHKKYKYTAVLDFG